MANQNIPKEEENNNWLYWTIGLTALAIIGLWAGSYHLLKNCPKKGEIGDMFGAVNALFSGLALAGIVITILLQRKELELQRKELRETRREFEIQNETLSIQRFENTFFSMLNLLNEVVNTMSKQSINNNTYSGKLFFEYLAGQYNERYRSQHNNKDTLHVKLINEYTNRLGHYFRLLYRIIKTIDESDFDFNTKYKYTSIVRSQLSRQEQAMLMLNCLTPVGTKFKSLVEKYCLLKNLKKIAFAPHIKSQFNKSAFTNTSSH